MKTTVYLAGKMTGLSYEEMHEWRDTASKVLTSLGFNVLDPTVTKLSSCPSEKEIVNSNKYQIQHADVILAELDFEEASLGTVSEIIFAGTLNKPVIAWGRSSIIEHPWISEHVTFATMQLKDALTYLMNNYNLSA